MISQTQKFNASSIGPRQLKIFWLLRKKYVIAKDIIILSIFFLAPEIKKIAHKDRKG